MAMEKKGLIKLLVSAALISAVLYLVDLRQLAATLATIPLWVIAMVTAGYVFGQTVSAYKWLLIARSGKIESSFSQALRAYFVGMFVNCFGFGIIGGDLARGLLLARDKPVKTTALASVFADRAHGLAVLVALGILSALMLNSKNVDADLQNILIILGLIIVGGWALGPKLLLRVIPEDNRFRDKAEQLASVFPKSPGKVFAISLLSVLFHSIQISLHYFMGLGFGIEIPLTFLFVTIPFVNILSSLPISWNGIGVRESAYVFFLSPIYLSQEQAVAFGAIWIIAITFASALGGLVAFLTEDYALLNRLKKKEITSHPSRSMLRKDRLRNG
jgi:uncharacterized membrane protein YbhN (UPF0104 family)